MKRRSGRPAGPAALTPQRGVFDVTHCVRWLFDTTHHTQLELVERPRTDRI